MIQKDVSGINMPLTLEEHFTLLARQRPDVQDLHSLWLLLRKDLEDRLPHSRGVFVYYSLHDATHSRSVIRAIERFLGDERISLLSATDTFMLLGCAYAHDYGMAMTYNQVYDALGEQDFVSFLQKQNDLAYTLEEEDRKAISNLLSFAKKKRADASLQDMYFAIMMVIQMYLRPTHWQGAEHVWGDFRGLFEGRLNGRFIQGSEGIIDICEAHGKSFGDILKLSIRADGIIGDEFHPRFIAAMLRLGDLLDLDNGRFPRWFVTEISRNRGLIPRLSMLHYKKHEAITHLLITPKRIEICASCTGSNSYETAGLVSEWVDSLEKECTDQIQHWSEITQSDFGRPPKITKVEILLNGKPYASENRKLQMRMSQDRVMKLLEGTSIYQDQYVGIRELVQNAIDASLLQLWDDITHNRYINLEISKHGHKIKEEPETLPKDYVHKEMGLLEHGSRELHGIFVNYSITVELIKDMVDQKVYVVVKDKGTGITQQDIEYMSDIGSSKEKNERVVKIMRNMPAWLKPSGVFGIGLQSAFQLTDCIEFYTRRPNEPERMISFHSYGRNHGKIEIQEMPPDVDGIYYDNAVPGTNVKIAIVPEKLRSGTKAKREQGRDPFLYYDREFDSDDLLHAIYVELSHIIEEKLRESPYDYFNIYFQQMVREEKDVPPKKGSRKRTRCSYFSPIKDDEKLDQTQRKINEDTVLKFFLKDQDTAAPFSFSENMAYYADEKNYRIYQLEVRVGKILTTAEGKRFQLPEPVRSLYRFQYKFNPIPNADSIYPPSVRQLRNVHAGFLYWDINILDSLPEKYLNIDRDRLREGAVMEEELTQVRKLILKNWCDYLIGRHKISEEQRKTREKQALAKLKKEGREKEFQPEIPGNIYKNKPRTLVSLALLFYQNVPEEQFRRFIGPYTEFLKRQEFILMGENFTVDKLWEKDAVFQSCLAYPFGWADAVLAECPKERTVSTVLHTETISRLPHRLIHMEKIALNESGKLSYYFKLGQSNDKRCEIYMDYAARLHDYSNAIDTEPSSKHALDIDSLVRKVFKPNQKYPHLLVPRHPQTFKRGRNFASPLDHCIRWYILSPFDRDMTMWLKNAILKDAMNLDERNPDSRILSEIKDKLDKYVGQSEQMEKCIKYVYKQHVLQSAANVQPLQDNLEAKIKEEYKAFLIDCCNVLIKQRKLIKNQFKKKKKKSLSSENGVN